MQAGQTASVLEMVDAVSEGLQGNLKIAEFDPKIGPLEHSLELERQLGSDQKEEGGDDDEEGEEFEFSFPCGNPRPSSSRIAAHNAFQNGHIRPIYPFFDQGFISDDVGTDSEELATSSSSLHQPLRKSFTEESGTVSTPKSGKPDGVGSPPEE